MSQETQSTTPSLHITKELLPNCRIHLNIETTPEQTEEAYERAIQRVNKGVSLPGFRKGKAPKKVVEKNYPSEIDREWRQQVLHRNVTKAIEQIEEKPLFGEVRKANLKEIERNAPSKMEVEYEYEPLSPTLDLSGFELKPVETEEIKEEDIALTMLKVRSFHGTWEEVTDRPAQEGDHVQIDLKKEGEKGAPIAVNSEFLLDPDMMPKWLFDALVGQLPDAKLTATSELESEEADDLFEKGTYEITLKAIRIDKPCDLDEELMQKLGVTSEEELREKTVANLEKEKKHYIEQQKKKQLEDYLLENYPLEIPETLLQYETRLCLSNLIQSFLSRGVTEDWLRANIKRFKERIDNLAKRRLSLFYLVRTAAKEEKIQLTYQEIQQEIFLDLAVRPVGERLLMQEMKDEEKINRVSTFLMVEKTLNHLLKKKEGLDQSV